MTVIDLLLIILIILASTLVVYTIITLKKLMTKVEAVTSDIHNFIEKANPVIQELSEVSKRANKIVTEAENYWDEIDRSIKRLKEKISDVRNLNFMRDAENPAKDLIKNIKAISKGISAFWQAFKRN